MSQDRGQFSSRLGFILAAAGSAVGLGNMVAFPVMASKNGGAAFLIVYLLFIALLCYPVMMSEIAMGRRTQRNPVGAFSEIAGAGSLWRWAGQLAILTPFMIAVFYLVITVWLVVYLGQLALGNLDYLATDVAFGEIVASPSLFLYMVFLMGLIFVVLLGGVKGGIEKLARILMPVLVVMLLALMTFVLTLENASAGVSYYLIPDFSKINGAVINGALGHAFFSLSLGMGILITYGSYFSKHDNIASSTRLVALADTGIAFFAGMLIIPAIFVFEPGTNTEELSTSSVSLIFSFLPKIFVAMQATFGAFGASVFAFLFFLLVFFAALTSLVSIIEIPIAYMIDEWQFPRRKAVSIQAGMLTLFVIPATMSLGISDFLTSFINYGGASKSFFDLVSDVFYETILPFGGFLVCLFCAYRWKFTGMSAELAEGDENYRGSFLEKYINFSLGTIIPVILFLVFLNTVAVKFFAYNLFGI
ncbi:MAG TPA: sodium-dependent transporter [Gammaproteobacteria bacterium]|nr:sodium-dependent transporter [Gammaproteobacteria bacterium]HJO10746.1 sodium-dependent transporter [Gammaproteobacteria bacterium]